MLHTKDSYDDTSLQPYQGAYAAGVLSYEFLFSLFIVMKTYVFYCSWSTHNWWHEEEATEEDIGIEEWMTEEMKEDFLQSYFEDFMSNIDKWRYEKK